MMLQFFELSSRQHIRSKHAKGVTTPSFIPLRLALNVIVTMQNSGIVSLKLLTILSLNLKRCVVKIFFLFPKFHHRDTHTKGKFPLFRNDYKALFPTKANAAYSKPLSFTFIT